MEILGMTEQQSEVLKMIKWQDAQVQEELLELEAVLETVGVHMLSKRAFELETIATETGTNGSEIATVLGLMRAARHGTVLSTEPIRVCVEEAPRYGIPTVEDDEGIWLSSGGGLSVFLQGRKKSYRLLGPAACAEWGTTPEAVAENVNVVLIDIDSDGDFDARLFIDGMPLDLCTTIEEFFGGMPLWEKSS